MKKICGLYTALILPSGTADIEIFSFDMVESYQNKRSLEITAQKANVYSEEQISVLSQINARMWSAQSQIYGIKADSALVHSETQDFQTTGPSLINTPDGYLFKTSDVRFDAQTRTMLSDSPVTLSPLKSISVAGRKFFLKGVGLELNLNKDTFKVLSEVEAEQEVSGPDRLKIESLVFHFHTPTSNIDFIGNVKVRHPDYNMRGQSLNLTFAPDSPEGTKNLQEMYLQRGATRQLTASIGETTFRSNGFRIFFDQEGTLEASEAVGAAEATMSDGVFIKAERLFSYTEEGVSKLRMEEKVEITTADRKALCEKAEFTPSTGLFELYNVSSLSDSGGQTLQGEKIVFSTKDSFIRVQRATGKMSKDQLSSD